MKRIIKKIFEVVYFALRGTAEMFGMFFFFVYIIGRTANGEWALGNLINGSVSKNGVFLTIMLFIVMFALGGVYKSEIDNEFNH